MIQTSKNSSSKPFFDEERNRMNFLSPYPLASVASK